MQKKLSRRDFLKLGGSAASVLAMRPFVPPRASQVARDLELQGSSEVATLCEMCVWRCGVLARIKNGRVIKLEGNPDHPHSRGKLCPRGQAGIMTTYDPDRVLTPLMRVGKRGEGKFRAVSWEEALDFTASNMLRIKQRYGPEAMIFSSTHSLTQPQFENLMLAYGSPNYGTQRSLCFNAMIVANQMTYGMEEPGRSYERVKYLLLTGRNLAEAISNSETGEMISALDRGAKMVYLDPRFTKTAAKADEWLPIRPGTDLAFHLAMLNIIIKERRYNQPFIDQYTVGFEELVDGIRNFTPEWASTITEIPARTIRRVAREFSDAGPQALAHNGWRTSNFINSFQTQRAITILNALVGNWGVTLLPAGGEESSCLGKPEQGAFPRTTALRLDGVPWKYPFVPLKLGIFQQLRDSILEDDPYPAHGWFISRQNPVQSIPDRRKTLQAFAKLDFIATVDISLNDSSWFADVVLPEATYLERYDPLAPIGGKAFLRQPVIEAQGETRAGLWIFKNLGERLGLSDFFKYKDEQDFLEQQLKPLDVPLQDIQKRGFVELPESKTEVFRWNTPSGKIEINSSTLGSAGFAPIPTWEEPPSPKPGEFYLLTGKDARQTQFATQNNLLLRKFDDEPRLQMNLKAATEQGLAENDLVEVKSEVGKVQVRLELTAAIRPDCVSMTPGFGHLSMGLSTAYGLGASDSDLHVTYTDPVSGGQALSQTFVTIRKIAGPEDHHLRKPLYLGES